MREWLPIKQPDQCSALFPLMKLSMLVAARPDFRLDRLQLFQDSRLILHDLTGPLQQEQLELFAELIDVALHGPQLTPRGGVGPKPIRRKLGQKRRRAAPADSGRQQQCDNSVTVSLFIHAFQLSQPLSQAM